MELGVRLTLYFTLAMTFLTPLYGRILKGKLGNEFFFLASWYSGPALITYAVGGLPAAAGLAVHVVLIWLVLEKRSVAWRGYPMLLYLIPVALGWETPG